MTHGGRPRFVLLIIGICIWVIGIRNYLKSNAADGWLTKPNSYSYCAWTDSIYVNPAGEYELHLCYESTYENVEYPPATSTIEESKIRVNGSRRRLRFEELASIPDAEWLVNFDRSVYYLYPQSIPIRDTLQSLISGKPVAQPPIFNPHLRFLQVPSNVCPPLTNAQASNGLSDESSHPSVVLVYKSAVYNFEVRRQLRDLYHLSHPSISIHLIFSIGLPRTLPGNVFQRDGFNVTLTNRAGKKLLAHSNFPSRSQKLLLKEMYEHDDLLVGDYEDTYYNLTLKLFHTFQWAARFCRPYKPIFVFLDDDYAVNINKLANFVRGLTPQLQDNLSYGYSMMENPVHRFNSTSKYPQWAFSKREIPWPSHTPEHLGIYSVWSYRHVHDMALAMHFTKPMVIDDTWLAMVQYKLNLTFTKLKECACSDKKCLFEELNAFEIG
ncbi:beta 13 n galactosyltransferase [Echinococcus multilocularis]|uniref:Hexosyltransferase n=1 Tax=Echinococcus multilocularis TaxID=6211 RepID=A0A068XWT7_ECHMU|nr:beta 13 n galactosyltransferase [Echinococcus multilocularis]